MRIDKRTKYLLLSLTAFAFFLFFSETEGILRGVIALLIIFLGIVGTLWVQYPNYRRENFLYTILLPVHLAAGTMMSLVYFPNLGLPTKILALIGVGGILYIISLINNIVLVMETKEEVIPLYKAALAWSQILIIVVAIPYISGVYKIPFNALFQNLMVSFSAFLFTIYSLWMQGFDADISKIQLSERVFLGLFVFFLTFAAGIGVSFLPTESFLRALFVSSVLMFALGYLQAHYKNSVTKKLIAEYLVITLIFLIFVLVFKS